MASKTTMKNEARLSKLLEGYAGNSELDSMHMKKKNVKEVKGLPISGWWSHVRGGGGGFCCLS